MLMRRILHDESSCPAVEVDTTLGNDGSDALESLNYVNEEDFICNIQEKSFVVTSDQMEQIKGKSTEANKITKMYGPMHSQDKIRKIIK
jgi:hypothetical protein